MASLLFPAAKARSLPVLGEEKQYPVNRIFCVGKNYAAHVEEMGSVVDREAPIYFTKSWTAFAPSGSTLPYPPGTKNYHYEMEMMLAIGKAGFRITEDAAASHIYGYGCALDMTRRDLQSIMKSKQLPWDIAKDVEGSAILGTITKSEDFGAVTDQRIVLDLNGETKQDAKLSELIWSVEEIISHLSGLYHLEPGDLILTGTPAGVGAVQPGDKICGSVEGLESISLEITDPE